ncbi:MAG: ATPase [Chloroflexota bacterium]|nr:ATPase [Chloroflexota bacterium]
MTNAQIAILAVDGGNSKTDVALVSVSGELRALVHGPTVSHQQVGLEDGIARLDELVSRAARDAGLHPTRRPIAEVAVLCLAGADYPIDVRRLTRAFASLDLGHELIIRNDAFAGLRAGTSRGWGVAVIAGSGMNCVGMAPDGRSAAFPAVGDIAGDWGGGSSLGHEALSAAIRGRDGRGPRTRLEVTVPEFFGYRRPADLTYALYGERIDQDRLRELAPLVFDAAAAGDAVAQGIVDRMADEVAVMAVAMLRRLRLVRLEVEVILAGGIINARDPAFYARIEARVLKSARRARLRRVAAAPVLGAALIGLDWLRPPDAAASEARLREALGA